MEPKSNNKPTRKIFTSGPVVSETPIIKILQKSDQSQHQTQSETKRKKSKNQEANLQCPISKQPSTLTNGISVTLTKTNQTPTLDKSKNDTQDVSRKSKAGKPTLKSMSIGDLIPKNHSVWSAGQKLKIPETNLPASGLSSTEFPALGSSASTPVSPADFPALVSASTGSVKSKSTWNESSDTGYSSSLKPQVSALSCDEFPSLGSSLATARNEKSQPSNKVQVVKNSNQKAEKSKIKVREEEKEKLNQQQLYENPSNTPSKKKNEFIRKQGKNSDLLSKDPSNTTNTQSVSAADFFSPKIRVNGDESDLLRLYQEGKFHKHSKGRQRLRPRRKMFTSLKKKVLDERLRQWKSLNSTSEKTISNDDFTSTVCIHGYCETDELEDDDEYDEILENLKDMSQKIGEYKRVFLPRQIDDEFKERKAPAYVQFSNVSDAIASVQCWNGLVLGGQELECHALKKTRPDVESDSSNIEPKDDVLWEAWCLDNERSRKRHEVATRDADVADHPAEVFLLNALTEDDLEDEECMEESMNDVKDTASKFGEIESMRREGRVLVIAYKGGNIVAQKAADELNSIVMGGEKLVASVTFSHESVTEGRMQPSRMVYYVELRNILTEDDLEDEDCLEETLIDVRELAQQFGTVQDVLLAGDEKTVTGDEKIDDRADGRFLRVYYTSLGEAVKSAAGFNGMVIGGQTISASLPNGSTDASLIDGTRQPPASADSVPMFSGDKLIPERFAECKRAPKIPNSGLPRKYATVFEDESVKALLVDMLGELMRLQQRAAEEKNAKAKRRIVMGLREVARGLRAHKVKLVVMANNLDEYGVIDEKLQEILNLAHADDIPVFYELNKRSLGKALRKSIKVAVAGIQNPEGAHQQFKQLVKIASTVQARPAAQA